MSERYTKGNREDDLTGFCGCGKASGSKNFKCDCGSKNHHRKSTHDKHRGDRDSYCDCDRCRGNRKHEHDRVRGDRDSHCDCESCRRKRRHDRDVAGERERHEKHPCEWERVDHERGRHYEKEGRPWVKFVWESNCECWGCVQNRHHNR